MAGFWHKAYWHEAYWHGAYWPPEEEGAPAPSTDWVPEAPVSGDWTQETPL